MKKILFWLASIGLAILATLPYLNSFVIGGDDACKHAPQIMALAEEIKAFHLPFGALSHARMGNGEISALMYPRFFSSLASWLTAFGMNAVVATKVFIFLLNLATILISYWSAKKITKSSMASWVITILYTFALYRIGDIYMRFALGEFVVMAFMPFVLYSIYNIFYEEKINIYLFPIAFFCVVNSHLITMTFVFIIFVIFFLANLHKLVSLRGTTFRSNPGTLVPVLKVAGLLRPLRCARSPRNDIFKKYLAFNWKFFWTLLKIGILTIIVSLGFLLPMLEQNLSQRLSLPGPWDMKTVAQEFGNMFSNRLVYPPASWGIGYALCLAPLFILIPWKHIKNKHFFITSLIIMIVSFVMTTNIVPWDTFRKLFSYVQFPWRFHTIFILFASFACGMAIMNTFEYFKNIKIQYALYGIIIALITYNAFVVLSNIDVRRHYYAEGVWDYNRVVAGNENYFYYPDKDYLPIYFPERDLWTTAKDTFTNAEYSVETVKTKKIADVKAGVIEMPITYYKGYSAKLVPDSGKKIKLDINRSFIGRMVLDVPQDGKVVIRYNGTPILWITKIISYGTMIWMLLLLIKKKYIFKRRK